jgi:V/A-type H+/Na+-transporting ATPase subunit E
MNCEELIGSLWQEAEKKIGTIIRETDEEETRITMETHVRISRLREDSQLSCSSATRKRTEETLSGAEKKARLINIEEDLRLSERLYGIATASLRKLRDHDYQSSFSLMVEELPSLDWTTVRVNPEDSGLARELFPEAGIITENGISGGLDVMTAGGNIRVINTLEKRLERAWGDILPHIIKEFYGTV